MGTSTGRKRKDVHDMFTRAAEVIVSRIISFFFLFFIVEEVVTNLVPTGLLPMGWGKLKRVAYSTKKQSVALRFVPQRSGGAGSLCSPQGPFLCAFDGRLESHSMDAMIA